MPCVFLRPDQRHGWCQTKFDALVYSAVHLSTGDQSVANDARHSTRMMRPAFDSSSSSDSMSTGRPSAMLEASRQADDFPGVSRATSSTSRQLDCVEYSLALAGAGESVATPGRLGRHGQLLSAGVRSHSNRPGRSSRRSEWRGVRCWRLSLTGDVIFCLAHGRGSRVKSLSAWHTAQFEWNGFAVCLQDTRNAEPFITSRSPPTMYSGWTESWLGCTSTSKAGDSEVGRHKRKACDSPGGCLACRSRASRLCTHEGGPIRSSTVCEIAADALQCTSSLGILTGADLIVANFCANCTEPPWTVQAEQYKVYPGCPTNRRPLVLSSSKARDGQILLGLYRRLCMYRSGGVTKASSCSSLRCTAMCGAGASCASRQLPPTLATSVRLS